MTRIPRLARLVPLALPCFLASARPAGAQPAQFTQDGITLRQDPALPTDAARKGYVDSLVGAANAAAAQAQATASAAVPQSQLGQPNGPARLGPAGVLPAAQLPVGTGAGTVAAGNDGRIAGAAQAASLATVATSGAYADLSGKPVIPAVPAYGSSAGTVAQGNDPRIPVVGNQAPGVGSMAVDLLQESGSYALQGEAGIWGSANVRAYMGVSRTFGSSEGAANGPVAALFGFANNNGSAADVVAVLGSSVLRQPTGSAFGANFIARTGAGISGKLVGLEVDVEPAAGTTASAGSIGVAINAYSSAIPGPAILMGGLSGGTFANGVQCAAVAATGSCLAPQTGSTPGTMMNSTAASPADAAIRIGPISAGAGQRIVFRGSDALDAVITTDANKFLKVATGTNGIVFTNQPQTANLLLVSGSTGDVTLPVATAKLTGTGDLSLSATTGQVSLLSGVKLAIRTVASGASDTAGAADATIKWAKAAGSASAQSIPACTAAIRGRVLVVKDGKGDAATNPITVTPAGGTVDAAASTVVNTARGAVTLQCDGAGDWTVLARM